MNIEQSNSDERDYSTISPSAGQLLLLKGLTNIPFAMEAAQLMLSPEKYEPDFTNRDVALWGRVVHFESRYWSIDQLLSDIPLKNILELSSGFSFRGLAVVEQNDIHYIDTDLDDVISVKKGMVSQLLANGHTPKGELDMMPLNALDEAQFTAAINHFDEGEVVIVNEGLLVYLDTAEKEKLCGIIRNILKQRGGYWITADIYIKREGDYGIRMDDKLSEFFKQHKIEENKFDSFEAAREFFEKQGFIIDKESVPDQSKLTALNYLIQSATPEQLTNMRNAKNVRQTWRLKLDKADMLS
jgi:O-methyltransferase involved in polyketide biosynthesis